MSDFLICLTAAALKSPSFFTVTPPLKNHNKTIVTVVVWGEVSGISWASATA